MLWILDGVQNLTPEQTVPRALPLLSQARAARIRSMRHPGAQLQSALAELLLRYALRAEYGLRTLPQTACQKGGKPYFPALPAVCFNLSHCATTVACALAPSPVGVDVQELRRFSAADGHALPAVYRVLSQQERAWVLAAEDAAQRDARFVAVWTCKEAYGKAVGVGLSFDMQQTALIPAEQSWQQAGWWFQHRQLPQACLTLCADAPMREQHLTADQLWNENTEEEPG